MLTIVLDTNIVISAAISDKGNPAKIINMVLDEKLELYYDEPIFEEYLTVISRPKFSFDQEQKDAIINGIKKARVLPTPEISVSTIPFSDESDRKFYDVARSCGTILVTGNTKHYPGEPFIMTPAQFLQSLENNPLSDD